MPKDREHPAHRPIRSFVLRGGRLTEGQQRALDEYFPTWGLPESHDPLDLVKTFQRDAGTILEIGFGNGESTWRMAAAEPEKNFIAIEVHAPGVGRLLMAMERESITNLRVYLGDAVPFLEHQIAPDSLDGLRLYFPDPWHKKRHHKRRLVQPDFIALVCNRLRPGAIVHFATDWVPYAEHMLEVLRAAPELENLSPSGDYCDRPNWRPGTKYEARGDRLGHETRDLIFRRLEAPDQSSMM